MLFLSKIKKMRKGFILIAILVLLVNLFEVSGQQYHSSSKKAIKQFQDALSYFNKNSDELALQLINKAIKYDEDFVEAYMMKAQILKDREEYVPAIESFIKALSLDPDFYPEGFIVLAGVEFNIGRYADAQANIRTFIEKEIFQQISKKEAEDFIKRTEFAINAVNNPVDFNPINLGDSINSNLNEYWPSITLDESKIIFTVMVPKDPSKQSGMSNVQEDFYVSNRTGNGHWGLRKSAGNPPNTPQNEGAQSISANGRYLYFTACDRMEGFGKCDIYYSIFTANRWGRAINPGSAINSKHSDKHPTLSADGKTIYFVSDRPGGFGGLDVYYSKKDSRGFWQMAINMGDKINTSGHEQSPYIHPDNQSLYFASEGHDNLGKGDIFLSRLNEEGEWGKAENLGYPINTYNNEVGLMVNPQGSTAYFSSDRIEERGMDIFSFELPENIRPVYVSYMKGRVYNAKTFKGIEAKFQLIDLETENIVMESKSNFGEGDFLVPLPTDKNYALNVSHPGYLFYSDHFEFMGEHKQTDPFLINVPLKPIKKGETIVLNNIFFEFDSHQLRKESKVELEKIYDFLSLNSKLIVEISGHTDDIGAEQYNKKLSEDRANSVVQYLIAKGIPNERIISKGYGASQAVAPNDNEENRAKNRRTELKVLEN